MSELKKDGGFSGQAQQLRRLAEENRLKDEQQKKAPMPNSNTNGSQQITVPTLDDEDKKVPANLSIKRSNKEKLKRIAKKSKYTTTSAFIDSLIDNMEE